MEQYFYEPIEQDPTIPQQFHFEAADAAITEFLEFLDTQVDEFGDEHATTRDHLTALRGKLYLADADSQTETVTVDITSDELFAMSDAERYVETARERARARAEVAWGAEIRINRKEHRKTDTAWRPIDDESFTLRTSTNMLHVPRRKMVIKRTGQEYETEAKYRKHRSKSSVDIDLLDAAVGNRERTPVQIEDPYNKGEYMDGYYYVRSLQAIIHKDAFEDDIRRKIAEFGVEIGRGAIIGPNVRIDDYAKIGEFTELEAGSIMRQGSRIGAHSILRKRAVLGVGAKVGDNSHVGQQSNIGDYNRLGDDVIVGREVRIAASTGDAADPVKSNYGDRTHIGHRSTFDKDCATYEDVRVAQEVTVHEYCTIGEGTQIDSYAIIGGLDIGANSKIGSRAVIAKGIFVAPGSEVPPYAKMLESNLSTSRYRGKRPDDLS